MSTGKLIYLVVGGPMLLAGIFLMFRSITKRQMKLFYIGACLVLLVLSFPPLWRHEWVDALIPWAGLAFGALVGRIQVGIGGKF
jgi:hypothetical protein